MCNMLTNIQTHISITIIIIITFILLIVYVGVLKMTFIDFFNTKILY